MMMAPGGAAAETVTVFLPLQLLAVCLQQTQGQPDRATALFWETLSLWSGCIIPRG